MSIVLDHVFICCEPGGAEAEALVALGLTEGTGNVHPGQGTANRRFFFHGGFIELLWVHDVGEAQSPLTAPTRLWERWAGRRADVCRFGVGFGPGGDEVPEPPFDAWPYHPVYLAPDKAIWFAQHTSLREPELFYLAWPRPQASAAGQRREHPAGLVRLRGASVGLPASTPLSPASRAARSARLLGFHTSTEPELRLTFDAVHDLVLDLRASLGLLLQGARQTG